eukprot:TRINITY_DN5129_c0_g1_i1.p1 TRINITY_DN5129_c0_g1~~TRINITY_DN5129_c0_g1_i1.p1  ORF type:complete len:560 (+),score=177.08 TRINITY_DN5129_c0_g1_i1:67-1746(+)
MASGVLVMDLTGGQVAFFLGLAVATALWLYAELLARQGRPGKAGPRVQDDAEANGGAKDAKDSAATPRTSVHVQAEQPPPASAGEPTAALPPPAPLPLLSSDNPVARMLTLHSDTLLENRLTLRAIVEFGVHLTWFFVCDRTTLLYPSGKKSYSRDLFWFLYGLLLVYSAVHTLGKTKQVALLNRDQTEEWKGWMQILFLMYHYFEASEQYNSIRLYIAAYVWMTGFGNFSFYYVRKDFSPGRFFQMLWRLNFMVYWVCLVLANDYMLYYICAMHTLWTFCVYFSLMFYHTHNEKNWVIAAKFAACGALVAFLFSDRQIWYTLWSPLFPLIQYVNPRAAPGTPGADPQHEWYFRAGLDRYVWMFGMLCANCHPMSSRFLEWVDSRPLAPRWGIRACIVAVCLGVGWVWYTRYFVLPKKEYNQVHPYTSYIPIFLYIVLRNLTPTLRGYSMHFFAFLGKITLETYIGQFHIWMTTGLANGQPKGLLVLVPDYPLINFGVVTVLYLWISFRLFELTNAIKIAFLPSKDDRRLYRNIILIALTWAPVYVIGKLIAPHLRTAH